MEAKVASSENFHAKIANIQFAIVAINALSKVCAPLYHSLSRTYLLLGIFNFAHPSVLVLTLLFQIQGFSERLVTASRPRIGLMFKQVCMNDFFLLLLLLLYFL